MFPSKKWNKLIIGIVNQYENRIDEKEGRGRTYELIKNGLLKRKRDDEVEKLKKRKKRKTERK